MDVELMCLMRHLRRSGRSAWVHPAANPPSNCWRAWAWPVTPAYPGVRDVASPCDADTIVMEVIR